MPGPHIIRLRGPWELQALARFVPLGGGKHREETHDLPAAGKVTVPGDWGELLGADFVGRARYTRRFNCPTNLGPDERVWLASPCSGHGFKHSAALGEAIARNILDEVDAKSALTSFGMHRFLHGKA